MSHGSGNKGTPRVPTPDDQEQSVDEFSDWDSWDDENEVCVVNNEVSGRRRKKGRKYSDGSQ